MTPIAHVLRRTAWATLAAAAAAVAPAQSQQPPERAQADIVARSNAFRRENGLAPVAVETRLARAAARFADFLARSGQLDHEADGREPSQRAEAEGYAYCLVAENIAVIGRTGGLAEHELAPRFVEGWIASPGHRKNLLAGEAVDTGVAIARSAQDGRYYAVQMFGRPAAMRLRFELANRSGRTLRYRFGDAERTLPNGVTRTHETCESGELDVQLPRQPEPMRLRPADGARYRIESDGQGGARLVGS